MLSIPPGYVNIATLSRSTHALGPGERSVVWVQGCPFRCPGCLAPDWIPFQPARLISIQDLVDELLSVPAVTGLVFSGGEPMQQAHALAQVARFARQRREISIITFSGYRYKRLLKYPVGSGIHDLLAQIDVLIEGPYVQSLNNGIGLRGSSNQRILHLTSRLKQFDLENFPRNIEIHFHDREVMQTGIPSVTFQNSLIKALGSQIEPGRHSHERI